MAKGRTANTYEEARKQRLEENKRRFEDLGISKASKALTEATSPEKKTVQHFRKVKSKSNDVVEVRRSSRTRNPVSYHENVGIDLPRFRKRSRSSSWGSYVARPLDELKEATEEERTRALEAAEALQSNLRSGNPSFVKSMVRSHVYSCFWLALPTKFCEDHLPKSACDMVLEDENDSEYQAVFLGNRTGLSGGWRAFALEHKLDDGDALVFELIEPAKFKIYIIKAFPDSTEGGKDISEEEGDQCEAKKRKGTKKNESQSKKTGRQKFVRGIVHEISEPENSQEHLTESDIKDEVKTQEENPAKKTSWQRAERKPKMPSACEPKREEQSEDGNIRATRKSKRGKRSDSGSPQQPMPEENPAKKTSGQKAQRKPKLPSACEPKREEQSEDGNICATRMTRKSKRGKSGDSGSPQQPMPEENPAKRTSWQKAQRKPKMPSACEPKREEQSEDGSATRMARKSKRGKSGDSGSPRQPMPESNIDSEVKQTSPDKGNGFLQHTDSVLKKLELVETEKCASKMPRKKSAPKFFRKKA